MPRLSDRTKRVRRHDGTGLDWSWRQKEPAEVRAVAGRKTCVPGPKSDSEMCSPGLKEVKVAQDHQRCEHSGSDDESQALVPSTLKSSPARHVIQLRTTPNVSTTKASSRLVPHLHITTTPQAGGQTRLAPCTSPAIHTTSQDRKQTRVNSLLTAHACMYACTSRSHSQACPFAFAHADKTRAPRSSLGLSGWRARHCGVVVACLTHIF
ncbi:uncharacterized protein J3D65DRAFT_206251 [Phyllosticta citribraziliensis]|uniref:Uncharacterized protein n=1 Tax=Phyllosticta citribraziliensis TaxID=989973 RepID=A0ABR1M3P2_9PEZI